MARRQSRTPSRGTATDATSIAALKLGDFALLDKVLLLEASVKRSSGVPDRIRDSLLHQLSALKDDLRVVCMVLVGEAPARTGAVPLPVWARSDEAKAANKENNDAM